MTRVLVTGATGRIGSRVVDELLTAGAKVRALTRRPDVATLPRDVEIVQGDLTQPESLDDSLRDVDALFLLWTALPATAPAVVDRIAAFGPRLVLLSSPHQTPHPFFQQPNPMAAFHADLERFIAKARLRATILRPGMFASNAKMWWAPQIRKGDVVRWPYGAAETAPVDERDIAAVAARSLVDDRHIGGDYVLTGPRAMTHIEQVEAIGAAIGRALQFQEITPDEFRTEMGFPRSAADMLLNAWRASLGHPAYVTTTVTDVLGRPARTFEDWARENGSSLSR